MKTAVKYVAELPHVREVSLLGTANLGFWKDRLEKENLVPIKSNGHAQLVIVAADSKFMGVRFRELSFSVLASQSEEDTRRDGFYLVHAFNSRRFAAFCERMLFSTPYYHGDVRVSASFPASIQLIKGGEVLFRAEMQADAVEPAREPLRSEADGWEGPVFLPGSRGKWFFARLRGHTQTYPFLPSKDSVTIRPAPESAILQALIDSRFAGREWTVRADATHAKSKTYKRSDTFVGVDLVFQSNSSRHSA